MCGICGPDAWVIVRSSSVRRPSSGSGRRWTGTRLTPPSLYASHYFWTGLELRALVPDPSRGEGFWFVTDSCSRSDGLSGFTGAFVRRRVRSSVEAAALAALQSTKQMLEAAR